MIVNELVINAAKHGAGKVTVTYHCDGGSKITVCDEGSGLPAGFDPATNGSGLGMKIADVLARQLGGSFSAGANPGGRGACFVVDFPGDVRAQARPLGTFSAGTQRTGFPGRQADCAPAAGDRPLWF